MNPAPDNRTQARKDADERIAAEPPLPLPTLPPGAAPTPVESHVPRQTGKPVAVAGIVENGLVRPLDPSVRLPELSRVIIVTAGTP